jgi:hypothetical protein
MVLQLFKAISVAPSAQTCDSRFIIGGRILLSRD